MHSLCFTPRYVKGNMHGVRSVFPAASHVELLKTHEPAQPAVLQSAVVGTLNFGLLQSSQHIPLSLGLCLSLHFTQVMLVSFVASRIRICFFSLMRLTTVVFEFSIMVSCSSMVLSTFVCFETKTLEMLTIFPMYFLVALI